MSKANIHNLSGSNNTLGNDLSPKARQEFLKELERGNWSIAQPPPKGAKRPPKHPGKTKESRRNRKGIAFKGGRRRTRKHRV